MEFDYEKNKVVGRIDHALKPDFISARIKIVGYIDSSNNLKLLDDKAIVKLFPPKGFVYAYKILHGSKFQINDIIQFEVNENPDADGHKDNFSVERNSAIDYGFRAYKIDGFKISTNYSDLSSVKIIGEGLGEDFYGITNKYVIGKLKLNNGRISSKENCIKIWDKDECVLFENENCVRLLKEPEGEYLLVDCMDDNLLVDWFREHIKNIDYQLFQKLNSSTNWKTQIPTLFEKLPIEDAEIEKLRLKRLESKINHIKLSWNDIIEFREQSSALKKVYNDAISKHIDELQSDYSRKKVDLESEFAKLKKELSVDLEKAKHEAQTKIETLSNELEIKKTEFIKAKESLEQVKLRLIEIEKEKARIISDFGIIKEVFSLSVSESKPIIERNYILEENNSNSNKTLTVSEYINNIQFYLAEMKIEPNLAKRIFETLTIYKALLISDIRIALAIVKATRNSKFIIQHTEPDWLHFKDFWNNGLSTIWNSAKENPEILHFFILEDINLSSPECYARPLLDVIAGIRSKIIYAETSYPDNLIILGTKASSQNPPIGLKLYEETFPNWGCIGFRNNVKPNNDVIQRFSLFEGKCETKLFSIDSDKDEIRMLVKEEYLHLFDEA